MMMPLFHELNKLSLSKTKFPLVEELKALIHFQRCWHEPIYQLLYIETRITINLYILAAHKTQQTKPCDVSRTLMLCIQD